MSARPTILLTGFGPFPGVPENATALLVPRLAKAARARYATHEVSAEILPTEWARAPGRLTALLAAANVVLALHFGASHNAEGFQIELIGRNLQTSRPDAVGEHPASERVLESGPELLAATLPAERIAARLLGLGYPCCTSSDAGTYLCNAVLYHSLAAARAQPMPRLAGFVHIPAGLARQGRHGQQIDPDCALDWKTAIAGGLEIIAACLEHAGAPAPAVKAG